MTDEELKLLGIIQGKDKAIADLKKENAELRNNGFTVSAMTEQQLKVALEKGEQLEKENEYAKTIIQDLLNNSDEYARQRAMDFLEEKK